MTLAHSVSRVLLIAALLVASGCNADANAVAEVAERGRVLVAASGRQQVEAPLGELFGDGALICVVLGDLGQLRFSPAVAAWADDNSVVEEMRRRGHEHMYFEVYRFGEDGALISTLRAHRRNPKFDLDTSNGADLDACFSPRDVVQLRVGADELVIVRMDVDGVAQ